MEIKAAVQDAVPAQVEADEVEIVAVLWVPVVTASA